MQTTRIKSIKKIGVQKTLDLEIDHKDHNFYADGLVVSNSHSASYSFLSALTLYLKYKYPQHFYTECLKMAQNKSDSQEHVAKIQQELNFFGIKLLSPDLIKSKENFSIEGDNIRYGFSSIKGVSEKSLSNLKTFLTTEKTNKFEVFNAAENSKVNVGIVSALIQAGMLNTLSSDREKLVFEAQAWGKLTDNEKTYCMDNGKDHDFDLLTMIANIHAWVKPNGKKVAAKTRLETMRRDCAKYKEIFYQNRQYPSFASWFYETRLLGYSHSTSLKNIFKGKRPSILNVEEIKNAWTKQVIEGVYEVSDTRKGVSGKGNKYLRIDIQDETGTFSALLVGDKYDTYAREYPDPVKGDIISIIGKKGDETVFIDSLVIQNNKIFMKLADIK